MGGGPCASGEVPPGGVPWGPPMGSRGGGSRVVRYLLRRLDAPGRVGVVQIECEHGERGVRAAAEVPQRQDKLPEVDVATSVFVLLERDREREGKGAE